MKRHLGLILILILPTCTLLSNNDPPNVDSLRQILADARGLEAANTLKALVEATWNKEREASFAYIDQLNEVAHRLDIDSISAYATYRTAIVTYLNGNYLKAAGEFADAATLYVNSNQRGDALQALAREGVMYSLMGDNDKAGTLYRTALQEARIYKEEAAEAYLLSQLATVFHYQSMVDSAKYYYQTSIEKYDALQDSSGMLRSMSNLLILLQNTNDLVGSLEVLQSIYDFQIRNNQFDNAAFTLCAKGDALNNMGRNNESFDAYAEAFDLAKKNGHNRAMYTALYQMSTIEINRDNPLKARSYLNEAFSYFTGDAEEANGRVIILINMGYTYLMTEQYDSAAYHYNSALAIADSLQFERDRDKALLGLGEARLKQGKTQEVKAIVKQLADLSASFNDPERLYSYYALEGALRLDLGDYSGAIPFLVDSYEHYIELGQPGVALEKAIQLLEAHKKSGQPARPWYMQKPSTA